MSIKSILFGTIFLPTFFSGSQINSIVFFLLFYSKPLLLYSSSFCSLSEHLKPIFLFCNLLQMLLWNFLHSTPAQICPFLFGPIMVNHLTHTGTSMIFRSRVTGYSRQMTDWYTDSLIFLLFLTKSILYCTYFCCRQKCTQALVRLHPSFARFHIGSR